MKNLVLIISTILLALSLGACAGTTSSVKEVDCPACGHTFEMEYDG
ncbi:MAG: hypothetical protein OET90_05080 [Desulfuromonadales bacterium]|nr:hypothetical protein [Desulfuromonadales bacterium]